jgi:hypothetical protein
LRDSYPEASGLAPHITPFRIKNLNEEAPSSPSPPFLKRSLRNQTEEQSTLMMSMPSFFNPPSIHIIRSLNGDNFIVTLYQI